MNIATKEEYFNGFKKVLMDTTVVSMKAELYLQRQMNRLEELLEMITKDNFWMVLPEILGIDSKLCAFMEIVKYEDLTIEEVISLVENDYKYYIKELCGYDLKNEPKHSIIFDVV